MKRLASLLDPFGLAAFSIATRYWTIFEKNSMIGPTGGLLLYNRLLWLSIAAIVLFLAYKRFRFTLASGKVKKKKLDVELPEAIQPAVRTVETAQDFSLAASIRQYLQQTKLEFTGILKSIPFLVMLALGVFNSAGGASGMEELFGTPVYPVTHLMLNVIDSNFLLFAFLILTLYSGELTWKERGLNLAGVMDALPVRDWVPWASKLSALILVLITLLVVAMLTTMGIQIYFGYTNFQFGLYLKGLLLVVGIPFVLIGVLAYFFQTFVNHKFIGFLLMMLFFISSFAFRGLHLEHNLYQFANTPSAPYSDMNGYGHFVKPAILVHFILDFCSSHSDCIDSSLPRKRLRNFVPAEDAYCRAAIEIRDKTCPGHRHSRNAAYRSLHLLQHQCFEPIHYRGQD